MLFSEVIFFARITKTPKYNLHGKCNVNASDMSNSSVGCTLCVMPISYLLDVVCHVHLLYRLHWVTVMCSIVWTESLSSAVSVELRHSHVPYRLNWVTFICCVGCIESLSCALSVELSHFHLLCRLLCLCHVICCIGCNVWVSLIPLYWLLWLCCICFTFCVKFIAPHSSLLCLILLTQHAIILILSISSTQTSFRRVSKTTKSEYYLRHICLSVCLTVSSSAWNKSVPTEWGFVKFEIWALLENL